MRVLALLFALSFVAGCGAEVPAEPTSSAPGYAGALDMSYQNALDPVSQLALGTLQLEGTANAVLEDQAASLLPLWQALQSSTLQGNTERNALIKQIETTMTDAQVSAIAAMRFTQEDVQTWAQSQGNRAAPGGGQPQGGRQGRGSAPQGGSEGQDNPSREGFQMPEGVSPEERATRRAQFGAQGRAGGTGPSIGGGTSVVWHGP